MPSKITRNSGSFPKPYEYKPGMQIGTKGWKSHSVVATKAREMVKLGLWKSETEKRTYTQKVDIETRMTTEFTTALKDKANPSEIAKGMASIQFEVPRESSYCIVPLQNQANPLQEAMETIRSFEDKRISYAQELETFKEKSCSYRVDEYQIIGQQKFETVTQDMAYDVAKKTIEAANTAQSLAAIKMTLGTEPSTQLMTSKQRAILAKKLQKKAKNVCKHETKALSRLQAPANATTAERLRAAEDKLHQIHRLVFAIDSLDHSFFHTKTEKGKTLCKMADACLRDYHEKINNVYDIQDAEKAQKVDSQIEFLFNQRFVPILDVASARGNNSVEAKEDRYGEKAETRKAVASIALEIIKTMRELPKQYRDIAEIEEQIKTIEKEPHDIEATRQLTILRNELKQLKGNKNATKTAVKKQLHKLAKHPSSDNMSVYMEPIIKQFDNRRVLDESALDLLEYQYQLDDLPPPEHLHIDDDSVDDIQEKRNIKMGPPGKSYHMDDSHWAEKMKLDLRDHIHPTLEVLRRTSQGGLRWQADFNTVIKNLGFWIELELTREKPEYRKPENEETLASIAQDIIQVRTNINDLLNMLSKNKHFGEQGQAIVQQLNGIYHEMLHFDPNKTKKYKFDENIRKELEHKLAPVHASYQQLTNAKTQRKTPASSSVTQPTEVGSTLQTQEQGRVSPAPIDPVAPSLTVSSQTSIPDIDSEGLHGNSANSDQESKRPSGLEAASQVKIAERKKRQNTKTDDNRADNTVSKDEVEAAIPDDPTPLVPELTTDTTTPPPPVPDVTVEIASVTESTKQPLTGNTQENTQTIPEVDTQRANFLQELQAKGAAQSKKYTNPDQVEKLVSQPEPKTPPVKGNEPASRPDSNRTHEPDPLPKKAPTMPKTGLMAEMHAKIEGKRTHLTNEILDKLAGADFYDSLQELADDLASEIVDRHKHIGEDRAKFYAEQLTKLTDSPDEDLEAEVNKILRMLQAPRA